MIQVYIEDVLLHWHVQSPSVQAKKYKNIVDEAIKICST